MNTEETYPLDQLAERGLPEVGERICVSVLEYTRKYSNLRVREMHRGAPCNDTAPDAPRCDSCRNDNCHVNPRELRRTDVICGVVFGISSVEQFLVRTNGGEKLCFPKDTPWAPINGCFPDTDQKETIAELKKLLIEAADEIEEYTPDHEDFKELPRRLRAAAAGDTK